MIHNPDGSSILGARYDEARAEERQAASYARHFGEPKPPLVCEWFALCQRVATGTTPHPAFPAGVPTCDRCNEFAGGEPRPLTARAAPGDDGQPCEPGGETLLDQAMRDA